MFAFRASKVTARLHQTDGRLDGQAEGVICFGDNLAVVTEGEIRATLDYFLHSHARRPNSQTDRAELSSASLRSLTEGEQARSRAFYPRQ